MKVEFYSSITNGKLQENISKQLKHCFEGYEGKRVKITIEKAKKTRSVEQNRYYWGVIVKLIKARLKELGTIFSEQQVHDVLKYKFLSESIPVGDNGEFIDRIKSTSELTTTEFMELIAQVQQWASETIELYIPDPNEEITINY